MEPSRGETATEPNTNMEKSEIIITDPERLEKIKAEIAKDGPEKFHVLADFDRTLTRSFSDGGKEYNSLISVLRNDGYLTPDYPTKSKAMHDYYFRIEIDPNIPREEKKSAMDEWWRKHFALLIASHLKKSDLERAVASQNIKLRKGADKFLKFLSENKIPLVIMSSSGIGGEAIGLFFKSRGLLTDNIFIVGNEFVWNDKDEAVGIKEPIIHVLNKDETLIKNFPFYNQVKNRKNVLLLGDSVDDVDMVVGFDYDNLIKIGFLNLKIPENLPLFRKNFDVIITNDGSMDFVNSLIEEIFGAK